MGFAEDVTRVLDSAPAFAARAAASRRGGGGGGGATDGVQMMLFSATLPRWVGDMAARCVHARPCISRVGRPLSECVRECVRECVPECRYMVSPMNLDVADDGKQVRAGLACRDLI